MFPPRSWRLATPSYRSNPGKDTTRASTVSEATSLLPASCLAVWGDLITDGQPKLVGGTTNVTVLRDEDSATNGAIRGWRIPRPVDFSRRASCWGDDDLILVADDLYHDCGTLFAWQSFSNMKCRSPE
jgi:hypothetical protein